jgi:zinc/manganese transport system substrate-binding protein
MRFPGIILAWVLMLGTAQARPSVLAAENFYGEVASEIAGPDADVASILSNPNQDPHAFEAGPAVARAVARADLVVLNGLDYDPWMDRLLAASPSPGRDVVRVADLLHTRPGDNPHIWYAPAAMRLMANALAARLAGRDSAHAAGYRARLALFLRRMHGLEADITALRTHLAGVPVTATEPVFGRMADALGLDMRDMRFQVAVMNGTEPRAGDVAHIEDDLRQHRVRVLLFNAQVSDDAATRLREIARDAGVPEVGVTETMPPGTDYVAWMSGELASLRRALGAPAP